MPRWSGYRVFSATATTVAVIPHRSSSQAPFSPRTRPTRRIDRRQACTPGRDETIRRWWRPTVYYLVKRERMQHGKSERGSTRRRQQRSARRRVFSPATRPPRRFPSHRPVNNNNDTIIILFK